MVVHPLPQRTFRRRQMCRRKLGVSGYQSSTDMLSDHGNIGELVSSVEERVEAIGEASPKN
jgi:hypothetical protein